jgi:hypothetical protein
MYSNKFQNILFVVVPREVDEDVCMYLDCAPYFRRYCSVFANISSSFPTLLPIVLLLSPYFMSKIPMRGGVKRNRGFGCQGDECWDKCKVTPREGIPTERAGVGTLVDVIPLDLIQVE